METKTTEQTNFLLKIGNKLLKIAQNKVLKDLDKLLKIQNEHINVVNKFNYSNIETTLIINNFKNEVLEKLK